MQRKNGTGTIQSGIGTTLQTGLVPVPNIVVPVPLVSVTPVFGICA